MSDMAQKVTSPTTIVIFGVTGDLAQRKLLPALLDLFVRGLLPATFQVVGFSRREWTDDQFRIFARRALKRKGHRHRKSVVEKFLKCLQFQNGHFDQPSSYLQLGQRLMALDEKFKTCSNKLYYLAVPPTYYETIFYNLAHSGLSIPCLGENEGWTRILVEKPFGRDLQTAQALDRLLGKLFGEDQIFRIDHYLAKETIQNILTFRFSNTVFEPIWNNQYIEKVEIKTFETQGVGTRGAFYDDIGALRDVGQNHLLQMLAAVAMEDPKAITAPTMRQARTAVLEALEPITKQNLATNTLRGQYQGYGTEKEVGADSKTETYFQLKTAINNSRWRGVPFYLEGGKRMKQNATSIAIYFKEPASCFCPPGTKAHPRNILIFRIQPDEGISVRFWAKKQGFTLELEPKELSFRYQDNVNGEIPDAYEQVVFDCIRGDQIRFISTEEVTASWRFITPILENWQSTPLHTYAKGSSGPKKKLN